MITKSNVTLVTKDLTLVENYDLAIADTEMWILHHRLETHFSDGTPRPPYAHINQKELIALGMYYHRPTEELIFMRIKDHSKLHNKALHYNEAFKLKCSESKKGKNNPRFGAVLSEETKLKISESNKGRQAWNKGKKMPSGFGERSHPEGWSEKVSNSLKGHHNSAGLYWFNNGKINTRAKECPEGFVKGRLKNKDN